MQYKFSKVKGQDLQLNCGEAENGNIKHVGQVLQTCM